MKGETGKRCPYRENAPISDDGAVFWQMVQSCSGQIRTAGMGAMIGYDLNAIFPAADALGLDRDVVLALLPAAEAGMREGIAKLKDQEDEEQLRKRKD